MSYEAERQEVFRCLFHGYLEMLQREMPDSDGLWLLGPSTKSLAVMYALLNTSLWESGKKKLGGGGGEGGFIIR